MAHLRFIVVARVLELVPEAMEVIIAVENVEAEEISQSDG